MKHTIPSSQHKPVLCLCADRNAADDMLQFGLHFIRFLAFIRESIEVGLERGALSLESVRGERPGLRGGGVRDRNVVFVHAEKSGVRRGI